MAGPQQQSFRFDGFPEGLNNVFRETETSPAAARELVNIDLVEGGKPRRRKGYTKLLALSSARSLVAHQGSFYFATGSQYQRVTPPEYVQETVAQVHPTAPVDAEDVNGYLYFTDGHGASGRVRTGEPVTAWSPENPKGQPTPSFVPIGSLPPGEYQVAVTFLRGKEESGTDRAATISLPNQGAIQLENIPQPASSEITAIRIYVSNTNSETLYHSRDESVGTTTTSLSALPTGRELETQFLAPLPAGHFVRLFNGRVYSVVDDVICFSEPMRFGLFNPSHGFIQMADRVKMFRPSTDGIYVNAAGRTSFFSGASVDEFTNRIVHSYGAVEGADALVPANLFDFESLKTGEVVVWWADNGVMVVGFPQGQITTFREAELALPQYTRGAIMARTQDGVRQLVSALSEPKSANPLAVSDSLSVEVHRNNIDTEN